MARTIVLEQNNAAVADVQSRQQVDRGRHTEIPARIGSSVEPHLTEFWEQVAGSMERVSATDGAIVRTLTPPRGIPVSLRFSPDGKTLAASGNGRVLLWDVSNLESK